MNKILNKKSNKFINLSVILLVIAIFLRLTGDFLFTFFDYHINLGDVWTLSLTLFIVVLLFSIFINNNFSVENLFNKKSVNIADISKIHNQHFFKELNILMILVIILLIINSFLPNDLNFINIKDNIIYQILSYSIAFCNLLFAVYSISSIYKWLYSHKHKSTLLYLIIITGFLLTFVLLEFEIALFTFLNESIVSYVTSGLLFFLFIFIFFVNTKNDWIALLPKKEKLKLFLLSFFALIVYAILYSKNITPIYRDSLSLSISAFTPGIIGFHYGVYLIAFAYFFKIFFITLLSLPTSRVVEKKANEFNNLKYLNRLIAGELNMDKLFQYVLKLSINQTWSSYAWFEFYEDNHCKVIKSINLDSEYIKTINTYDGEYIFKSIDYPFISENLKNDNFFKNIRELTNIAGSLISLPIYDSKKRVGSLVLLHVDKFGLDYYNLETMTAFSNNVSIAFENSRLMKQSREHERFKNEMILARDLQKRLLPEHLPDVKNYTLSAFSIPAQEAGGDYYDLVSLKNGNRAILIGDVSGKGIGAAFIMAQLKGVVHSMASRSNTGKELLININNSIYSILSKNEFITMSCLVINGNNGKLSYTRAGHTPLIINNDDNLTYYKPKGLGLGIINTDIFENNLEEINIELENNSICYLFTDGINELRNAKMEELGYDGINSMIKKNGEQDAEDINSKIKKSLSNYAKNIDQTDDMTLFTLYYKN